ncbi:MAG TPA: hypothetical protein VIT92_00235, partial [Burkholderiaceae bacterium]
MPTYSRKSLWALPLLAALIAPVTAHAAPPVEQRELLNSVLWLQHATEYKVSAAQVYQTATERLRDARKPGTASLEQLAQKSYA